MDVKSSLGLFRDLLNSSWPSVLAYEEQYKDQVFNDFRINWLQANWEMTVEKSVLLGPTFLQVYGSGADFGDASSRMFCPDAGPTHRILCKLAKGRVLLDTSYELLADELNTADLSSISTPIVFNSFVTFTEKGWFEEAPPFDCVIADYDDTQILFKFDDAEYSLEKID